MLPRGTRPILVALLAIALLTAVAAAVLLAVADDDETSPATTATGPPRASVQTAARPVRSRGPAASDGGVTYAPRARARPA